MRIRMSILNSNDYYLEDEIKVQKLSSETLKNIMKWGFVVCIVILLFMINGKNYSSHFENLCHSSIYKNLLTT